MITSTLMSGLVSLMLVNRRSNTSNVNWLRPKKGETDMHTFTGHGCTIHYNGDYSGNAIVCVGGTDALEVPCADLLSFVAEAVTNARVEKLEQMPHHEVLGLNPRAIPVCRAPSAA